jgi:hypothetical protein
LWKERTVKKITKTSRQILTALGQYPSETKLLDAGLDEEGPGFAIRAGTIRPGSAVLLDFLGESDGRLVRIAFDEGTQTVEFTVD